MEIDETDLISGSKGILKVAVKNTGAGHAIPSGAIDQKHIWLEVEIKDSSDKTIYHSGWFDKEKGQTDPDAVIWAERFWDRNGQRIYDHMSFKTHRVDITRPVIKPREKDVVTFNVMLPKDIKAPVTVNARLWYRVAMQELALRHLKTTMTLPPFLMAEASKSIGLKIANSDLEIEKAKE